MPTVICWSIIYYNILFSTMLSIIQFTSSLTRGSACRFLDSFSRRYNASHVIRRHLHPALGVLVYAIRVTSLLRTSTCKPRFLRVCLYHLVIHFIKASG